jgi:hypothetical protein
MDVEDKFLIFRQVVIQGAIVYIYYIQLSSLVTIELDPHRAWDNNEIAI